MLVLFPILALLVPISSAEGSETSLNHKETFETLNSMYTNDLVWSDEWAQKALDWLKSPENRESMEADLIVGGRSFVSALQLFSSFISSQAFSLIANANDKPVWQKILDVLEIQFDEAEAELERLPPGTLYGCNGYMSTRNTKDDYVSAVCLYKEQ
uniref:Secreted protein n=1 Tax=Haemonchus contortus TaxID=6289 RepID=A0A7I4XVR0_HAECO